MVKFRYVLVRECVWLWLCGILKLQFMPAPAFSCFCNCDDGAFLWPTKFNRVYRIILCFFFVFPLCVCVWVCGWRALKTCLLALLVIIALPSKFSCLVHHHLTISTLQHPHFGLFCGKHLTSCCPCHWKSGFCGFCVLLQLRLSPTNPRT